MCKAESLDCIHSRLLVSKMVLNSTRRISGLRQVLDLTRGNESYDRHRTWHVEIRVRIGIEYGTWK